jgi:hypothetical protein
VCFTCGPGQFQALSNATRCLDCARGFSQAQFNATSCTVCAPGKFSNFTGARQCVECPDGSYPLGTQCILCAGQAGLDCSRRVVAVRRGYWAYTDARTGQWITVECTADRCQGSINISSQCTGTNRDPSVDNQLCGRCLLDYADTGGTCICNMIAHWLDVVLLLNVAVLFCADCPHADGGLVLVMLLVLWALVLVLHATSRSSSGLPLLACRTSRRPMLTAGL